MFQVGGLIWMVHHGLAPDQSGDGAQRRLYVDLLVFPNGQTPRLAPRPPAAALARRSSTSAIRINSLTARGLDLFEASLVVISARSISVNRTACRH